MCLVSLARFLAPSYRLLPSSTHLCEQLLSREQVQRLGEAPSAKSDIMPLPKMEIFDTITPSLVCAWLICLVGPRASTAVPAAGLGGRKRRRSHRDERVGRSSTRARRWARFDRPGRLARAIERHWRTSIALRARQSLLVVAYLGAGVPPTAQ